MLVAVSVVAFFVGLAGLVAVPVFFARLTYLSENALQPGSHGVAVGALATKGAAMRGDEASVEAAVKGLGLERVRFDDGTLVAVVRSSRGGAGSCVAISVHYDNATSTARFTGAAFAVKLADYLRTAAYVGKDVLFVWTRPNTTAVDRFVKRYYELDSSSDGMNGFRRSGQLQAAFHLEFAFNAGVRKVVFELEGDRLPNLDLLNSFVRGAAQQGINQKLMLTTRRFLFKQLQSLPPPRAAFFLQFFLTQALVGSSQTPHAELNAYACEALTVSHVGEGADIRAEVLFNAIEAALRSVLTLQETLHQSFYFYILPSVWLYVPIGDYMILFGLCFAVFPAVVTWFALFSDARNVGEKWSEIELFSPFLIGAIAWKLPSVFGMALYGCALFVALFLWGKRQKTSSDLLFLIGTGYFGMFLVLCVLVNFPLAMVGCAFGMLQLAAFKSRSRVILMVCDPFLLSLGMAQWSSVYLASVPFRLLLAQAIQRKIKTE